MTVGREGGRIVLEGNCGVEDAEPLLQMLVETPEDPVDWRPCEKLHTAVIQVILIAAPELIGPCGDGWVETWISPHRAETNSGLQASVLG